MKTFTERLFNLDSESDMEKEVVKRNKRIYDNFTFLIGQGWVLFNEHFVGSWKTDFTHLPRYVLDRTYTIMNLYFWIFPRIGYNLKILQEDGMGFSYFTAVKRRGRFMYQTKILPESIMFDDRESFQILNKNIERQLNVLENKR